MCYTSAMEKKIELLSWNINGIRAVERKGFFEWFKKRKPDILALQEIKAEEHKIPEKFKTIDGYFGFFNPAVRPGYSGTAILTKIKPKSVRYGFGIKKFDDEGRTIIAEFDNFDFYCVYFPNGKMSPERLKFKMDFYEAFLKYINKEVGKGKNVVVCGDVNTAHMEIDLARPQANKKISGFLPKERAWMDKLFAAGYVDTFRNLHPDLKDKYSWWSQMARARDRNVGWRIDYFIVNKRIEEKINKAFILDKVMGSDHAPVGIEIDF